MKTEEIKKNEVEETASKKKMFSLKMLSLKLKHKIIIIGILVVLVLLTGFIGGYNFGKTNSKSPTLPTLPDVIVNPEADIDVSYLNTALKEASELTTAKLKINGLVDYNDTGIILLNKADFKMLYSAEISAGIDMAKVKIKDENIDHENKIINVYIPKAAVFKPNVYHGDDKIKFFDEKFSLFNVDPKEDLSRALELAEMHAKQEAIKSGLLDLADKQSKTLIKGILSDVLPNGYTVNVSLIEE